MYTHMYIYICVCTRKRSISGNPQCKDGPVTGSSLVISRATRGLGFLKDSIGLRIVISKVISRILYLYKSGS